MVNLFCFVLVLVTFGVTVFLGESKLKGRTKFVFIVSAAIAFIGSSYAILSKANEDKVEAEQEQTEKPKTKERIKKTNEQALHDVEKRYESFIDHLCRDYPNFCKVDRNVHVDEYDVVYTALLAPYSVGDNYCGFKILIDYDDSSTVIRLKWIAYAPYNEYMEIPLRDYLLLLDFILNTALSDLGGVGTVILLDECDRISDAVSILRPTSIEDNGKHNNLIWKKKDWKVNHFYVDDTKNNVFVKMAFPHKAAIDSAYQNKPFE